MKKTNKTNQITSTLKPALFALGLALLAGSSAMAGPTIRPGNSTVPTPKPSGSSVSPSAAASYFLKIGQIPGGASKP